MGQELSRVLEPQSDRLHGIIGGPGDLPDRLGLLGGLVHLGMLVVLDDDRAEEGAAQHGEHRIGPAVAVDPQREMPQDLIGPPPHHDELCRIGRIECRGYHQADVVAPVPDPLLLAMEEDLLPPMGPDHGVVIEEEQPVAPGHPGQLVHPEMDVPVPVPPRGHHHLELAGLDSWVSRSSSSILRQNSSRDWSPARE